MTGRMGAAIEQTLRSYPGVLENNQNLMFMLKCRQFIEMVNGSDFEPTTSSRTSPVQQTSVIQSTKSYQNGSQNNLHISSSSDNNTQLSSETTANQQQQDLKNTLLSNNQIFSSTNSVTISESNINLDELNNIELNNTINLNPGDFINDVEMESSHITNGEFFICILSHNHRITVIIVSVL